MYIAVIEKRAESCTEEKKRKKKRQIQFNNNVENLGCSCDLNFVNGHCTYRHCVQCVAQ